MDIIFDIEKYQKVAAKIFHIGYVRGCNKYRGIIMSNTNWYRTCAGYVVAAEESQGVAVKFFHIGYAQGFVHSAYLRCELTDEEFRELNDRLYKLCLGEKNVLAINQDIH